MLQSSIAKVTQAKRLNWLIENILSKVLIPLINKALAAGFALTGFGPIALQSTGLEISSSIFSLSSELTIDPAPIVSMLYGQLASEQALKAVRAAR